MRKGRGGVCLRVRGAGKGVGGNEGRQFGTERFFIYSQCYKERGEDKKGRKKYGCVFIMLRLCTLVYCFLYFIYANNNKKCYNVPECTALSICRRRHSETARESSETAREKRGGHHRGRRRTPDRTRPPMDAGQDTDKL